MKITLLWGRRDALIRSVPVIVLTGLGLVLAGCRAGGSVRSPPLTNAERATIGDTIRHLSRQSSQTFDSDLDCEQIVARLAPAGEAGSLVAQGRIVELTSIEDMVRMCRAIKQDRVSAHEDIQEERVEVLGPDAAVLVTRSIYTVRFRDGRPTRRSQVVTTVWSRRSGEWRRVHLHESWQASEEGAGQASAVPRFEAGPCPFERGAWADAVTLECGRIVVPESRARPGGRTLRLEVAVLRASQPSLPPLVMLQGGPGHSGLDTFLPAVAASPLPRMRDVVVYDQRGAGYSEPALCPDYNRRRRDALAADAGRSTALEREAPVVRWCLATLRDEGIDPSAYTTAESAADLVDLRQALGYRSWDVYGQSHGALQALVALALDPEGVRSVVLDRPPKPAPNRAELALSIQRALDRLFAACAADAGCRTAFPDPAADLEAVVEALDARPIKLLQHAGAGSEFVLDGAMLVHALAGGLDARARRGWIPFLLHELRNGDRERAARELAGWAGDRSSDGPATISLMPCNDQYGPRALAVEDSVLAAVSAPVRSIARIRTVRTCALWTDRTEPASLPTPMGSRTPVLIVVGEYDVSAPPEDGRWIASLLRNATLVEMPSQGHADAALPEQPCAQRIMSQFSQEPTRPLDTSCVAGLPGNRFVTRW